MFYFKILTMALINVKNIIELEREKYKLKENVPQKFRNNTICAGSSDPFYRVGYYIR